MKIRIKLLGGFSVIALIGLSLGVTGFYGNQKLTLLSEDMLLLSQTGSSISAILDAHYRWRHDLSETVYSGIPFKGSLDPTACAMGTWLNSEESANLTDAEVIDLLDRVRSPHEYIHLRAQEIVSLLESGRTDEAARIYREDVLPKTLEVISILQEMSGRYETLVSDKTYEIYNVGHTFTFVIVSLVVFALVVSIGLAILITLNIVKPITGLTHVLKDISEGEGDLTRHINNSSKDEIGDLSRYFDLTLEKIRKLVVGIKGEATKLSEIGVDLSSNTNETAAAINEITANIQSIRTRVINQSASVTETNATMEQVTSNIGKLDRHIEEQSNHVSRASAAIEEMVASIRSVTDTLVKNASNVQQLKGASEIGRGGLQEVSLDINEIARESEGLMEINAVINNIASQTNLLSMNAAIEAAHAGEAGKGFAVVADEIRKLAESSSEQSKTISTVLKKMNDSMEKITKSTQNVLDKFEDIDSHVKVVAEQEENILTAMKEQGEGSRQVLDGIELVTETTQLVKTGSSEMQEGSREVIAESSNLEKATQEIAAGINEMATGAEQINIAVDHVNRISTKNRDGIETLIREVSRFKVE